MITQEIAVHEHPDASGTGSETSSAPNGVRYYKRDFWSRENLNYAQPHFRLEKAARVVNRMAGGKQMRPARRGVWSGHPGPAGR